MGRVPTIHRHEPSLVGTPAFALRASARLDLGLEIFDWLEVVDAGDAFCPHGQVEVSLANIKAKVASVVGLGIIPITIGGDHTVTWPAATAVAEPSIPVPAAAKDDQRPVGGLAV